MFNEKKFRGVSAERGVKMRTIAESLGIDPATLYRKVKGNSDFTRAEIQEIVKLLSLSAEEVQEIFFSEKLA